MAGQEGPEGGASSHSHPFQWVFLIAGAMILLTLAATTMHDPLMTAYKAWRLGELWLVSWTDPDRLVPLRNWLSASDPKDITYSQALYLAEDVGSGVRWLVVVALLCAILRLTVFSTDFQLRRRYSLDRFIRDQAQSFPILTPLVRFDPSTETRKPGTVPARLAGTWQEALQPHEWLAFYHVPVKAGIVDADVARDRFVRQLGGKWQGLAALPPHAQAFFAALTLHGHRKREQARAMAGEMAQCWWPGKGFVPTPALTDKVMKILSDPDLVGPVLERAARHYFVNTALLRVIDWAKERGGNYPSSFFVWLRPVDRTLWYVFNDHGRRPSWVEAAAVRSHYLAEMDGRSEFSRRQVELSDAHSPELLGEAVDDKEKIEGRPIKEPQVEPAIGALQQWVTTTKPKIPRGNRAWRKSEAGKTEEPSDA